MRLIDLIKLIFENLNRRKGRVVLTAIGVVIGTAAVVILVSLAIGLQQNATNQFGSIADLTQISVWPGMDEGGGGGGNMVVIAGGGGGGQTPQMKLLTPDKLKEFEAMPGVVAVIPREYMQANAFINYNKLETYANIVGMGTSDMSFFGYKLASGTWELKKGTAIIGGEMVKSFYDPKLRPGQEPPPPPELQDQEVKLTLIKYTTDANGNGVEVKKTMRIKIVGVTAETNNEAGYTMYMSLDDITAINEWVQGKRINYNKTGYSMVTVKVDDREHVLDVSDQITQMGFQANSAESYVQSIDSFFVVLQVIFGGVGAVALLVAAIGIANTMTMAIMERTREIGLMKAVGATNRDVLSIFLGEASGIGFIGGLGGVIIGWGGGQIINVLASAYLAGQATQGGPPTTLSIYTPTWLPIFAILFATLVGLLSGLYPALRAATLVPITALKYE
ncbi:MAG TPA: ABC transporter permease [Anaerolineaceae bacterium]|nr:ABC transporter permease [Anaerolineaceae bacterium]HPN53752.1 ABC transporter permease [Anaerolineaceae bacterium]